MYTAQVDLFVKEREKYSDFRIPAMVVSDQGVLYVAFECRQDASDWADIDLCIMKSVDGGVSFQEIKKIYGQGKTMNNPVLFLRGDTLIFMYCQEYKRVFFITSRDGGETWDQPEEITAVFEDMPHTVVATGPGHGIVTQDGTFVAPVWLAYDWEDPTKHYPSYLTTIYSQDGGKTWKHGEKLEAEELESANETAIATLQDGSVLLNIRIRHSEERARFLATSKTGYDGWNYLGLDHRMPDPRCMGSMCNGGGKLFFSNCESVEGRKNLTLKISDDDFATFEARPICDIAAYSEIAYWDNKIFVLYETYLQGPEKRYDHKLHMRTIHLS